MIRFIQNMGFRYVCFRIGYEIRLKSGLLKLRFPVHAKEKSFSLENWRLQPVQFFFDSAKINLERNTSLHQLKEHAEKISQNRFLYFSSEWHHANDWHTHPKTGFTFDSKKHWTEIPDFSRQAGDIKYVWEKSRFTFLYDLIRYDFHFQRDQSKLVFAFITDWIDQNPVNCGPNWRCGQEITLRVINWTFAVHYYKFSETLTPPIFEKVVNSIRHQMRRVEGNSSFTRIAVRNNHALTETFGLYFIGLLYPLFPESGKWKQKGKRWFEQEIAFQIDDDGTFLQYSMNYHRIAVQLLTMAICIAEKNQEKWPAHVYTLAEKSLHFLQACQDGMTGWLPNYGNNDGALFFPLTDCHFRDFRPQLAALANALKRDHAYGIGKWNEETSWFSGENQKFASPKQTSKYGNFEFKSGGYYILKDRFSLTFLRCGSYEKRPFQADNLHVDIWANGINILRDGGTFQYNTDENLIRYFAGTASHNTVMIGDFDQMLKGPRFIWFGWIRKAWGKIRFLNSDLIVIEAEFEGFYRVAKGIRHKRKVFKEAGKLHWIIEDSLENVPANLPMKQIWHPCESFFDHYEIHAQDEKGNRMEYVKRKGWNSESYGQKTDCPALVFSTFGRFIQTTIKARNKDG
ncbi:heparinase [Dyadobacter flavalbus]|uniref:Heparinase n=1 Tax=Dyadobacter flavalbus TaxID=2579942 RepID=A0A5M8QV76_9BACT|nr:alginate lyase family protein [Dyadobacter flavalbus]KAA6440205.1 heparinase [Dyadobacter flavalbus]